MKEHLTHRTTQESMLKEKTNYKLQTLSWVNVMSNMWEQLR